MVGWSDSLFQQVHLTCESCPRYPVLNRARLWKYRDTVRWEKVGELPIPLKDAVLTDQDSRNTVSDVCRLMQFSSTGIISWRPG